MAAIDVRSGRVLWRTQLSDRVEAAAALTADGALSREPNGRTRMRCVRARARVCVCVCVCVGVGVSVYVYDCMVVCRHVGAYVCV